MLVRAAIALLDAEEQRIRRQHRTLAVSLHQPVAVARVLPEALERCLQFAVQDQRGAFTEVIEYRRGFLEEQRQVVLDAGAGDAGTNVLVDAALGGVSIEQFAPAAAKP